MTSHRGSLREIVSEAFIIAHREDTSELETFFAKHAIKTKIIRGPYPPSAETFDSSERCLLNHANAWTEAAQSDEISLVVEADFVPCAKMFTAVVDLDGYDLSQYLVYLYACSPELWEVLPGKWARGHAGGTVAYLLHPRIASMMLQFKAEHLSANPIGQYSAWDAAIGYWLKEREFESLIPVRNFGEHGGVPNPEHRASGLRRTHRADSLIGRLAFKPIYAKGRIWRLIRTRSKSVAFGVARLACGRLFPYRDIRRAPAQVLKFAFRRFVFDR